MPDKNKENKIQEMQITEQNLQNMILQKQAFNMELSETRAALKQLEISGDDVFKIIGQLMIKSDKEKIKAELENKEKILDLRLNSITKQENSLKENLEELRREIL